MPIKEIGDEVENADDHFAHKLGHGDVKQYAGVGFEHRHVKHKEGEW